MRMSGSASAPGALLPLRLFRSKISNLGLGTQVAQWLVLQGSFFCVSVYLQEVWKYNAIQTGLILVAAIFGLLATSAGADRLARRHSQRSLIVTGHRAGRLGPGGRQAARGQALRRRAHHAAGDHADRPRARRTHSPQASRGHSGGSTRNGTRNATLGNVTGRPRLSRRSEASFVLTSLPRFWISC